MITSTTTNNASARECHFFVEYKLFFKHNNAKHRYLIKESLHISNMFGNIKQCKYCIVVTNTTHFVLNKHIPI